MARGDPDRASHLEDLRQFRLHLLRARKTGFLYPENEGVDREVLRRSEVTFPGTGSGFDALRDEKAMTSPL